MQADNRYTVDRQESSAKLGRLLLRTGEGTPVADILPTATEGGQRFTFGIDVI